MAAIGAEVRPGGSDPAPPPVTIRSTASSAIVSRMVPGVGALH